MAENSRLIFFLACDQARQEERYKHLFIGVYGASIIVEGPFPAFLPSLVLAGCLKLSKRKERIAIRVHIPGVPLPQSYPMEPVQDKPAGNVMLLLSIAPCVIPESGTLRVEYEFEDGHVEEGRIEVIPNSEYKDMSW